MTLEEVQAVIQGAIDRVTGRDSEIRIELVVADRKGSFLAYPVYTHTHTH